MCECKIKIPRLYDNVKYLEKFGIKCTTRFNKNPSPFLINLFGYYKTLTGSNHRNFIMKIFLMEIFYKIDGSINFHIVFL